MPSPADPVTEPEGRDGGALLLSCRPLLTLLQSQRDEMAVLSCRPLLTLLQSQRDEMAVLSCRPLLTLLQSQRDEMVVRSCVRRSSESIERRFCFDVTAEEREGQVFTLQAMSEDDLRLWMDAMDGKEPVRQAHTALGEGSEGS